MMRQWERSRRNSRTPKGACGARVVLAKYRSAPKIVRPIDPNGTRPISILRPDRRSHRSEPTPTPTENKASSMLTTSSVADRTSLVYTGNWERYTAPRNQNQEMPSTERYTVRLRRMKVRIRQVSETGFQLMTRSGAAAGEWGIARLARYPSNASTRRSEER